MPNLIALFSTRTRFVAQTERNAVRSREATLFWSHLSRFRRLLMRAYALRLLLLSVLSASPALAQEQSQNAAPAKTAAGSICIVHVTVVDTENGKEVPDRTVVISGDRISEVTDSKGAKPPAVRESRRRHGRVLDSRPVGHARAWDTL
jgi:hypothetical protein